MTEEDDNASKPKSKRGQVTLTKQAFGKRLGKFLSEKGWSASDLARATDLGRDSTASYLRGAVAPKREALERIATALNVTIDDLLPKGMRIADPIDAPEVEMQILTSDPRRARLQVNRIVSTSAAVKIIEILNDDMPSD